MPSRFDNDGAVLIVTADDYGYAPGYNAGLLEAVRAGVVDAVSAMVQRRWCEPAPVLASGVEIGLHLELPGPTPREQLQRFEALFGRRAAHLDGHHHCHARAAVADDVASLAAALGLPVRSVDARHRRMLHRHGVATPDRLIGRTLPSEPPLPDLLQGRLRLPHGVTEWMVHPGHADPRAGSSYDAAREEDLELLLRVGPELAARCRRETHAAALAGG